MNREMLSLYWNMGKSISEKIELPTSELAIETLKDPYKFDFLTLKEKAIEKDIEEQLVKHITSLRFENTIANN